jgi:hypothetical protein
MLRIISLVQPGFIGRKPKWRIAWSSDCERWSPSQDGRLNSFRELFKEKKAGIDYIRANQTYIFETYSSPEDIIYTDA